MKQSFKNLLIAAYLYYIMCLFKTSYSIHHPIEILIQKQSITNYLKHSITLDSYENRVCPFGQLIAKLMIIWVIIRSYVASSNSNIISNYLWSFYIIGALIMNLNVAIYLLPAILLDLLY